MGPIAKAASEEEAPQAAEYFAAIKPIPWVKVIEAADAAKNLRQRRGASSASGSRRRHRAHRSSHPRNSGKKIQFDRPSQSTLPVCGVPLTRQRRQGRGTGEDRRLRQDHFVRHLSWGRV